jgi:tetrahydromethanopterin S-methyltransferase subunit G
LNYKIDLIERKTNKYMASVILGLVQNEFQKIIHKDIAILYILFVELLLLLLN